METDKLNKWFTLLANVGVVVGLAILILEINQTNSLAKAEAIQGRSDMIMQAQKEYALSEYLPEITAKYREGGVEALTLVELDRLQVWENARRVRMSAQYRQYQMGFLDQETAERTVKDAALSFAQLWDDIGLEATGEKGSLDGVSIEFLQEVQRAQR